MPLTFLLILFSVGTCALLSKLVGDCSASSPKADKVRAISKSDFADMHAAMRELRKSKKDETGFSMESFSEENIPSEFHALNCISITWDDYYCNARLEGCFDHHLDVVFHGTGESMEFQNGPPRIELVSGEHESRRVEVLWEGESEPSKQHVTPNR